MKISKLSACVIASVFALSSLSFCAEKRIVINLPGRSLALYNGDEKVRLYPIAIGKPSTPTPVGYYKISSKDKNPRWTDPGNYSNTVAPGPNNPLGMRWMQLYGNYGIHGTNNPNSIGNYVSNGCIRMFEENVEELFDLVEIGTPVEITYNRVVVEKTAEDVVTYYVYPDNYDRQPLSVADIKKWLTGFGVQDFVTDEEILAKINASDGAPTFIGKINPIIINGEKLKEKAVQKDGVMYLPLAPIAEKLNEKYTVEKSKEKSTIVTDDAMADAFLKNQAVYLNAKDLENLFKINGALSKNREFVIGDKVSQPKEVLNPKTENNKEANKEISNNETITKNNQENNKEINDVAKHSANPEVNKEINKEAEGNNVSKTNVTDKKEQTSKQIKRGKPTIVRREK